MNNTPTLIIKALGNVYAAALVLCVYTPIIMARTMAKKGLRFLGFKEQVRFQVSEIHTMREVRNSLWSLIKQGKGYMM